MSASPSHNQRQTAQRCRSISSIVHVQPAIPRYRLDFFERLYCQFGNRLHVYYSPGTLGALTQPIETDWAHTVGPMRDLPLGLAWQPGVARIPVERDDIVVLSGNPRQLSTLVLLIKARIAGAQVIWWGHYWSSTSRRWRQVLRHLLMTAADALLFYTDDEVEAFEKDAWKFKKAQIVTSLNNGIDIKDIRRLRIPYRARERKMELLFIGRLTPKANLGLG